MTVNFDTIKYIFSIPLDWYRQVHNACFKTATDQYIDIKQDDDGTKYMTLNVDALDIDGKVKSVDGVEPNDDGDVNFGLAVSKWMKTDANGHLGTTNDNPALLVPNVAGVIYNNNGTQELKSIGNGSSYDIASGDHTHDTYATKMELKVVKETVSQVNSTATAARTIAEAAQTKANSAYQMASDNWGYIVNLQDGVATANAKSNNALSVADNALSAATTAAQKAQDASDKADEAAETAQDAYEIASNVAANAFTPSNPPSTSNISDWSTATSTFLKTTDRLSQDPDRGVSPYVHGNSAYTGTLPGAVDNLYQWVGVYDAGTAANLDAYLSGQLGYIKGGEAPKANCYLVTDDDNKVNCIKPTDKTKDSMAVYHDGKPTFMTHTATTFDGLVVFDKDDGSLNLAGSSGTALVTFNNGSLNMLEHTGTSPAYVCMTQAGFIATTLTANKVVKTNANGYLTTTDANLVQSVDGHEADTNGAVSFGLTKNKPVITDSNGHLTTTTGATSTFNVGGDISWNGTQLVQTYRSVTITNGIVTSVGTEQTRTIGTVTYNP